ncbi:MAG: helix-turn-helix domain-containing protein, partial [Ligilactobacillus sp.]|nr:helix-turn-helix domain-containing protein [Ligilactobacillus sp.]
MAEKLYTTQELADNIGVSRSTIYRFLKVNQIQPVEINGRSKLYSKDTLKQARRELLLPSTSKKTTLATEAKHLDQLQHQLE